jgi:hypothetical protein
MAGHRRRRAHDAGLPLAPTQRRSRLTSRRARLTARYAAATTDAERFALAAEYTRGAAARRHPDPERAKQILSDITAAVIRAGDDLIELQAREPNNPARPVGDPT